MDQLESFKENCWLKQPSEFSCLSTVHREKYFTICPSEQVGIRAELSCQGEQKNWVAQSSNWPQSLRFNNLGGRKKINRSKKCKENQAYTANTIGWRPEIIVMCSFTSSTLKICFLSQKLPFLMLFFNSLRRNFTPPLSNELQSGTTRHLTRWPIV